MISGFYTGILGIIFLILSYNVIFKRLKYKIGIGSGNNHKLEKSIRIQGNFIEYVPITLIMLFLCEINQGFYYADLFYFIHSMGAMLVVARILHAIGLTKTSKRSYPRAIGIILTHFVILSLAGVLIHQYFSVGFEYI